MYVGYYYSLLDGVSVEWSCTCIGLSEFLWGIDKDAWEDVDKHLEACHVLLTPRMEIAWGFSLPLIHASKV